jgi:para-nitrobenzyl esterase
MKMNAVALAATVLASGFPASAADLPATRVNTTGGMLEGRVEAGVRAFKGIAFVATPIDALRFRPRR